MVDGEAFVGVHCRALPEHALEEFEHNGFVQRPLSAWSQRSNLLPSVRKEMLRPKLRGRAICLPSPSRLPLPPDKETRPE